MPTIRVEGRTYDIPIGNETPYRVQIATHDPHSLALKTTQYTFHLPDPKVKVEVFEQKSGVDRCLVGESTGHIANFLVGPGTPIQRWQRLHRSFVGGPSPPDDPELARESEDHKSYEELRFRLEAGLITEDEYSRDTRKLNAKEDARAKPVYPWDGWRDGGGVSPKEAKKNERGSMSNQFVTGSRVWIKDPFTPVSRGGKTGRVVGTVVQIKNDSENNVGRTLLCLDEPRDECQAMSERVGKRYGWWISSKALHPLEERGSALFAGVPAHMGVCAKKTFSFGSIVFRHGSLGRVLSHEEDDNSMVSVAWMNVDAEDLWDARVGDTEYVKRCYSVPWWNLSWCYYDPSSFNILAHLHSSFSAFKEGDLLVYTGEKPVTLTGREHKYVLTKGAIIRYRGYDEQTSAIAGAVAGGIAKSALGMPVSVGKAHVTRFEGTYLPSNAKVEVVAEVVFRKKDLRGREGKVILPTDEDGDVGVEFPDDIEAGSLDGVGKEGRCLYIPASALKETSAG